MQQHQPRISPDYDDDFYAWTQNQAKLLRAFRKSASDIPSGIDLDHLAEEIEDLGQAELRSVTSLIRQILVHLIKAASEPGSSALPHWRTEATTFSLDLPGYYAPSMRQLVDMRDIWRKALKAADVTLREHGAQVGKGIPGECPYTIDEIVTDDFDFDAALKKLGQT